MYHSKETDRHLIRKSQTYAKTEKDEVVLLYQDGSNISAVDDVSK